MRDLFLQRDLLFVACLCVPQHIHISWCIGRICIANSVADDVYAIRQSSDYFNQP